MDTLAGALFLATFVEGVLTYFFGENERPISREYIPYIAVALGVIIAIAYEVNIPSVVGVSSSYSFVDFVVSGVMIGRGSNYINDIVSTFRRSK